MIKKSGLFYSLFKKTFKERLTVYIWLSLGVMMFAFVLLMTGHDYSRIGGLQTTADKVTMDFGTALSAFPKVLFPMLLKGAVIVVALEIFIRVKSDSFKD